MAEASFLSLNATCHLRPPLAPQNLPVDFFTSSWATREESVRRHLWGPELEMASPQLILFLAGLKHQRSYLDYKGPWRPLMFTEGKQHILLNTLFCLRHIISFNIHQIAVRESLLSILYQLDNWVIELLSHLPRVTQLAIDTPVSLKLTWFICALN